jgi:hypothetical protein
MPYQIPGTFEIPSRFHLLSVHFVSFSKSLPGPRPQSLLASLAYACCIVGSDEDNPLYLKYYADEGWRRQWHKNWPKDPIPRHEDPPYARDRLLQFSPIEPKITQTLGVALRLTLDGISESGSN